MRVSTGNGHHVPSYFFTDLVNLVALFLRQTAVLLLNGAVVSYAGWLGGEDRVAVLVWIEERG